MTVIKKEDGTPGKLLEQIVNASTSLLEEQEERYNFIHPSEDDDEEEEEEEEEFEDGDEDHSDSENECERELGLEAESLNQPRHEGVAAVLTELSQVASSSLPVSTSPLLPVIPEATRPPSKPTTSISANTNTNTNANAGAIVSPNIISSLNALLQSHLNGSNSNPSSSNMSSAHKVRLSGPIRANVNIRHGVWAPRLRCRKRKNLHAKDGIWIHPACTPEHLIDLVKRVLPDEFDWDPQSSPLRYQAVNDQSLQSLKTVSGTIVSGQSLYSAFDLVRNRRSDGDNFILQLYVYGSWTVLLKPHMSTSNISSSPVYQEDESHQLQPPPKKKYQQAHYNQIQMHLQNNEEENSTSYHVRNNNPGHSTSTTTSTTNTNTNINTATNTPYTHPLAANPPVTFLPTVSLEMKLNGIFVPVEVSRRSFIAAIRACSIPKPSPAVVNSTITNNGNGNNIPTPPPSDA